MRERGHEQLERLYRLGVAMEKRMGILGKGTMKVLLPEAYQKASMENPDGKEEKSLARRISTLERELWQE